MKGATLIPLVILAFSAHASFAMDCSIVEYPDHTEVVCEADVTESKTSNKKNLYKAESPQRIELIRAINNLNDKIDIIQNNLYLYEKYTLLNTGFDNSNVSGITVDGIHIDAANNKYINVTISCFVTNMASGDVSIRIEGISFQGLAVHKVMLEGYVEAERYTKLSTTTKIKAQQFQDIRKWEPRYAKIQTKIDERGEFNEKESKKLITNLRSEANSLQMQLDNYQSGIVIASRAYGKTTPESVTQEYNTGVVGETIKLFAKNGNVSFSHNKHQSLADCTTCHINGADKLTSITKNSAHQICKGCHSDKGAGPTKCGGCHKK